MTVRIRERAEAFSGQWSVGSGQWPVVSGPWAPATGTGNWARATGTGNWHWQLGTGHCPLATGIRLLSFPTVSIGNPGVFPMQGYPNEGTEEKTGFPLKTAGMTAGRAGAPRIPLCHSRRFPSGIQGGFQSGLHDIRRGPEWIPARDCGNDRPALPSRPFMSTCRGGTGYISRGGEKG